MFIIMHHMRRTTLSASADSLATLEAEARRRGVPVARIFAEAVDEKAAAIRRARKPRVGLGRSTDGRSAADTTAEPVAEPPR
jgi:soluble P-type ATPase